MRKSRNSAASASTAPGAFPLDGTRISPNRRTAENPASSKNRVTAVDTASGACSANLGVSSTGAGVRWACSERGRAEAAETPKTDWIILRRFILFVVSHMAASRKGYPGSLVAGQQPQALARGCLLSDTVPSLTLRVSPK